MTYSSEDLLPLSGLQHFAFCRRQWALIHLEQQWQENLRTVEGDLLHPVEYKRGRPKSHQADQVQLCAQAMCLEEMLCCSIPEGALFYGEPRRRTVVPFTPELRETVRRDADEMRQLYRRGYTPKAKPSKSCNACSLKELCLPQLVRRESVQTYLRHAMEELP